MATSENEMAVTNFVPDSSNSITTTNIDVNHMTPAQKEHYREIGKSLVIGQMSTIGTYGSELNSVMSQNANTLLSTVKQNNGNEVTKLTTELLGELGKIDIDELDQTPWWKRICRKVPFLKGFIPDIEQLMHKYDTIAEVVEEISKKINATGLNAAKDNNDLEIIFQNNKEYVIQVGELIAAAQVKLEDAKEIYADTVQKHQEDPNNPEYDEIKIKDISDFIMLLEKKVTDLQTIQYTLKMNLLEIRGTQNNNLQIRDKASTFVNQVIPVWKNQLSISLMMDNQRQNVQAQKAASDFTNKVIRKNAEMLKTNSIEVAKEAQRGIIDIDTLRKATSDVIDTVKQVSEINKQGQQKRLAIQNEIKQLEDKMNQSVIIMAAINGGNGEKKMIGTTTTKTIKELKGVSADGSLYNTTGTEE